MLLYQLTQWFEERNSLQKALLSGVEDPTGDLQLRMREVEEQLYSQAERWRNEIGEASYVQFPYEAPYLKDDMVL
ncbi:hypothetical protein [Paenibacillus sp. N3.4]|uniref:hypothetical protein n=1 Tax=Paenibacillus sp. N3.4 TaxID=2603222 RepID=UPI0011CC90A9|nr:hypothetical protein [Paenibacillus sp. N3.4]TXK85235.1 hypothetical protein FU659_04420 [Paenibacillus sp. N3.4]